MDAANNESIEQKNKRMADSFGFYAILTNPMRGYEYLTQICVEYAVAFVQLRMKESSRMVVLRTAEKLRKITEKTATRFIVNDFPDVALDCGADGVHIGQSDQPFHEVRAMVTDSMIVGISTHTVDQTKEACALGPDYIGIGPVFPTPTKKIADPAIGIEGMKKMVAIATVPAVCLGGITFETLPDLITHGARNFSLVRPLCDSPEPGRVLRTIGEIYLRHREHHG